MPNPTELLLKDIQSFSGQSAISDLLGAGVDEQFLKPMLDILKNSIYNGSNIEELISELQIFTQGDASKVGSLLKYIGQVSSDSITQYTANYSKILTDDLGLVFYKYSGNLQKGTRCFCEQRANKFYHQKEIEAWGDGITTAGNVADCGFPWQGMIAGTNSGNIFTYRGGWNCEHYIIAVSTLSVPRDVIMRNIANGNFVPNENTAEYFGIR